MPKRSTSSKSLPDPEAIFNALAGKNEGENWRHVHARQAYIEELVRDQRVKAAFAQWGKPPGLTKRVTQVAVVADRLARSLTLDHRRELFMRDISVDVSDLSSRTLARLEKQKAAIEMACLQFWKTMETYTKRLAKKALDFVREDLELSRPFVVTDLLDYFMMQTWSLACGAPHHRRAWFEPKPPGAHTIEITFASEQDLKRESARVKREGLESVKQSATPRGRVPKKKVESIRRNVRWFVRNKIGGVLIADLAKEYHDANHPNLDYSDCNDWTTVDKGIREAERLLNLTSHHFK
jgi:hypothetical protein